MALRMRKLERQELTWLALGLLTCVLLMAFVVLAGIVAEGNTAAVDTRILRSLRSPDDLSRPIGPHWLELMMLDLTAVGGPTVLSLVVLIIAGFLFIEQRHRMALGVLVTSFGGMLVTAMLKQMYDRPRPS